MLREVGELTASQPDVLDISQGYAAGSGDVPGQPAQNGQPAENGVSDHHHAALERLSLADGSSDADRTCSNGHHIATEAVAPVQRSTAAEAEPSGQDGAAAEGREGGCEEEEEGYEGFVADELTPPERDTALAAQQVSLQSCTVGAGMREETLGMVY